MDLLMEFWSYLKARKRFWLLPILLSLALFSTLTFISQSAALSPFLYALF